MLTRVGPSSSGYSVIQDLLPPPPRVPVVWLESLMDELSPAVQLEPCTSMGKGCRWRGCAAAGQGGLQGSPRTLLGSGGSSQNSSGSGDILMASHLHGITSLCTAGTHGENFELLTKRNSWRTRMLAKLFLGLNFVNRLKNSAGKSAFLQW